MIFLKIVVFVLVCYVCVAMMEFVLSRVGNHYTETYNKLNVRECDVFMLKCVAVMSVAVVLITAAGCYAIHLLTPWFLS